MTRVADRQLRKDLLFKALDKFTDLDKAFEAVIRMEQFILGGDCASDASVARETPATAKVVYDSLKERSIIEPSAENEGRRIRKSASRNRWHRDEDALLVELCKENLTVKDIAKQLGRTPASIYGRIHHHGLPLHKAYSKKTQRNGAAKCRPKNSVAKDTEELKTSAPQALPERTLLNSRESVPIEEVIRFLRTRDYSIISTDDGRYQVDGRHIMTAQQLLQRANRVRESLGHSRWNALSLSTCQSDFALPGKARTEGAGPCRQNLGKTSASSSFEEVS